MQREQQAIESNRISNWMMFLLAAACGLIVANLYYAQTLVGPIHVAMGLSSTAAGFIVTLTQVGYVVGLLFIVPLSDIIENRRLMVVSLVITVGALLAAAFAPNAPLFLTASLFIGIGSVVAQILVPYATYLASEEQRGTRCRECNEWTVARNYVRTTSGKLYNQHLGVAGRIYFVSNCRNAVDGSALASSS